MTPNTNENPNMLGFDIFIFNEGRDILNKEIDALKELHEIIIND